MVKFDDFLKYLKKKQAIEDIFKKWGISIPFMKKVWELDVEIIGTDSFKASRIAQKMGVHKVSVERYLKILNDPKFQEELMEEYEQDY